MSQVKSINWKL